jgi:hypothetical protein
MNYLFDILHNISKIFGSSPIQLWSYEVYSHHFVLLLWVDDVQNVNELVSSKHNMHFVEWVCWI